MVRRSSFLVGCCAAAIALLVGLAAPVAAAAETAAPVTWAVGPADDHGRDHRAWVEQEADAGVTLDDKFAVQNLSTQEVTFRITAADGYFTSTGRFNMLNSDQTSVAAGTWITVQDSVTVGPGATAIVPFTTTIPANAQPGDYAAGIAASIMSVSAGTGGGPNVGVESRVGFRVMTRVLGDLVPQVSVEGATGDYHLSWNPFRAGSATLTFDVVDTGNTRLVVDGSVMAAGRTMPLTAADAPPQELLPGERRTISIQLDDLWPLFAVPVTISLTPTSVSLDGDETIVPPITADALVWAVPVPQLLLLLAVLLIIGAVIGGRLRNKLKTQRLIEEAREEGRRSAAGG